MHDWPKNQALILSRVIHQLGGAFSKAEAPWSEDRVPSEKLAKIVASVLLGKITNNSAKKLLSITFEGDSRDIESIMKEENMLVQDVAEEDYMKLAQGLVDANLEMVQAIKEKGQHGKVMWFVGQMMREMAKKSGDGSANPEKSKIAVLTVLNLPLDTGGGVKKK
jgi:aspartyl-tRNA(Asn)/glutamyl-tRNA(Gln) amidotransferase subunit B